jgi:hypothetical protein
MVTLVAQLNSLWYYKGIIIKQMWKTKRIEDLVINDNYDSFDNRKIL